MRVIAKYDETVSENTEVEHQPAVGVSRKSFVVGVCAVLAVMAIGASKWSKVTETASSLNGDYIEMAEEECSDDVSTCMGTRCCKNPGRKCYLKNNYWANCNETCDERVVDGNGNTYWNCSVLPPKTECSDDVSSCADSGCCKSAGHVCFVKNRWWANCNDECKPGKQAYEHKDYKGDEWRCEIHMLPCDTNGKNESGLKCCIDFACEGKADSECVDKKCGFYKE
jgi:hypothetical protein